MKRQARWAMIDNFDSFTYNLVQSFGRLGVTQMTVWRSDEVGVDEIYSFDPDGLVVC